MSLIGKRVFADVIKWRIMRQDHPGFSVGPESHNSVLRQERQKDIWNPETSKADGNLRTEQNVEQPQIKEYLEQSDARRGKEVFSSKNFGGSTALSTPWFQISDLQNCKRIFLLFYTTTFVAMYFSSLRKLMQKLRILLSLPLSRWLAMKDATPKAARGHEGLEMQGGHSRVTRHHCLLLEGTTLRVLKMDKKYVL